MTQNSVFTDIHDYAEGYLVFRVESNGFIVEFRTVEGITTFARYFDIVSFIPAVLYYIQWSMS